MFRIVLDDLPGEEGFHDVIKLDALRHHLLLRVLRDANLLASYLLAATRLKGSDVVGWQKLTSLLGILSYGLRWVHVWNACPPNPKRGATRAVPVPSESGVEFLIWTQQTSCALRAQPISSTS